MNYENILVTQNEKIATITINRPKKLNALNKATIEELHKAFSSLQDDDTVKVILLTGSGEKAFVAGADISEFAHFSSEEGAKLAAKGQELLFDFVENLSKPVIALVNGFALGGGLELAMSCHFRIASENAKMGLPETSLGVIPGYGGTQRLPQLIGKGRSMEMILTGKMINAQKALDYGLVNEVVEQDQLDEAVLQMAENICKNSPNAIGIAISTINAGYDVNQDGFEVEKQAFGSCFKTADFNEGVSAFLQKRKPNFQS